MGLKDLFKKKASPEFELGIKFTSVINFSIPEFETLTQTIGVCSPGTDYTIMKIGRISESGTVINRFYLKSLEGDYAVLEVIADENGHNQKELIYYTITQEFVPTEGNLDMYMTQLNEKVIYLELDDGFQHVYEAAWSGEPLELEEEILTQESEVDCYRIVTRVFTRGLANTTEERVSFTLVESDNGVVFELSNGIVIDESSINIL